MPIYLATLIRIVEIHADNKAEALTLAQHLDETDWPDEEITIRIIGD